MSEKKQLKAIKMKLLTIVTENYVAAKYVAVMNKKLMKMDRGAKSDELGALRNLATEIETELTPVNEKVKNLDMKMCLEGLSKKEKRVTKSELEEFKKRRDEILFQKQETQVKIQNADKMITGFDTAEQQIIKFKARVQEAVFQYRNFDAYAKDIIKLIKE